MDIILKCFIEPELCDLFLLLILSPRYTTWFLSNIVGHFSFFPKTRCCCSYWPIFFMPFLHSKSLSLSLMLRGSFIHSTRQQCSVWKCNKVLFVICKINIKLNKECLLFLMLKKQKCVFSSFMIVFCSAWLKTSFYIKDAHSQISIESIFLSFQFW